MSLFRRSAARVAPAAPPVPPAVHELTLLVTGAVGRRGLVRRAESTLRVGEALVMTRDLVGRKRSFRTVPLDRTARLVAREPALVLQGGLTALVAYYLVPAHALGAREEHFEDGVASHSYDVQMQPLARGRAAPLESVVA